MSRTCGFLCWLAAVEVCQMIWLLIVVLVHQIKWLGLLNHYHLGICLLNDELELLSIVKFQVLYMAKILNLISCSRLQAYASRN
jgi:hypothetical protein